MTNQMNFPAALGQLSAIPRACLFSGTTALEELPNLTSNIGGARLFVKRDDCTNLAFGGNKVRQLEFYFGEAIAQNADCVLITGAVQSNFVRLAAAGACKLGMECHIQLEERVANTDAFYRTSGNVLIDRLLGATLHSYPHGEDEVGADRRLGEIADDLRQQGRRPYIIPLAPGHPPLGALGYVVAARELLGQIENEGPMIDEIIVASGSGNTHAGLLFGLRALGSNIPVTGVCVRRDAAAQALRLHKRCLDIAELLEIKSPVSESDVVLTDAFLAPGYGKASDSTLEAIKLGARSEGLMLDPTYTGKVMAGFIDRARTMAADKNLLFIHTGGAPAIFGYETDLAKILVPLPVSA